MVAGCKGRSRYNFTPICKDCPRCPVGKYISDTTCGSAAAEDWKGLTAGPVQEITCSDCLACPAGTYLAKQCSGSTMGTPDHIYQPCARCPRDTYVALCGSGAGDATIACDPNDLWLQKPADADVCEPCATCPSSRYISRRCSGSGTQDDRKCSPRDSKSLWGSACTSSAEGTSSTRTVMNAGTCHMCTFQPS
jgi:hypothetical protein